MGNIDFRLEMCLGFTVQSAELGLACALRHYMYDVYAYGPNLDALNELLVLL